MNLQIRPDWNGATTPFRHTWEGLVNIDQFRWMVRADVLAQLKMAHDELGARHVRAVGMWDDEMRVLGIDPQKFGQKDRDEVRLNWQVVDYVMDSLLEIGISPMFTTTFVPGALASGHNTVFTTKSHVDPPRDWREWEKLVTASVEHAVDRYGLEIVQNWHFEVWNEPNLSGFWSGGQDGFWKLWQVTQGAIKNVDAGLKVGGPSTARAEWVGEMVEWGQNHDCAPDFIITHIYNNDSESSPLSPFDGPQSDKTSKSPHFATGVVRGVRRVLDELGFAGEVHWNEWGRSWLPFDPPRESAGEAAFIAKTMAEVSQDADFFAYWNLSDVYDQVGYGAESFHGNYGMLSLQSLRKPNYFAHQLLSKLGHERLETSANFQDSLSGAIATLSDTHYAILIYHGGETASPTVEIELPEGTRTEDLTLWRLSETENNILALWREMGSPDNLKRDQVVQLRAQNELRAAPDVKVESGEKAPLARFPMEAPGVVLLQIRAAP